MAVKTYQDSKDKYLKEKVDTFVLRVPKGKKDEIMEYAKSKGKSLNGYITELIFLDMGLIQNNPQIAKKAKEQTTSSKNTTPKKAPADKKPVRKAPVQDMPTQETPAKDTEIKKKKMPSFLL